LKAYHGTFGKKLSEILFHGFSATIRGENRLPNDLGVGVYAFIKGEYGDPKIMAANYIRHFIQYSSNKNEKWIVLEFDISPSASILNLDSESKAFDKFRKENEKQIISVITQKFSGRQNLGLKHRGNFDGVVTQLFLRHLLESHLLKFDAVQKDTFTNISDGGYRQSNFFNGTELCVYNTGIISNIKECE